MAAAVVEAVLVEVQHVHQQLVALAAPEAVRVERRLLQTPVI